MNHLTTSAAGAKPSYESPELTPNADGSVTVTLTGSLPLGFKPQPAAIAVPSPTKFAKTVFREALAGAGLEIKSPPGPPPVDFVFFTRL